MAIDAICKCHPGQRGRARTDRQSGSVAVDERRARPCTDDGDVLEGCGSRVSAGGDRENAVSRSGVNSSLERVNNESADDERSATASIESVSRNNRGEWRRVIRDLEQVRQSPHSGTVESVAGN